MENSFGGPVNRRTLLATIGTATSAAVMYQAMASLGHAAGSDFEGPIKLEGDAKGASVLILGAGLAGMTAALELRKAGYKVQVLEFQDRAGGRTWSLRGGDSYTELGGFTQHCGFDEGLYINPGPWRIPYHHRALLHYCKTLGVRLEPFVEFNANSCTTARLSAASHSASAISCPTSTGTSPNCSRRRRIKETSTRR
jgi:monoamine oxidase